MIKLNCISSGIKGIRYREHKTRKVGIQKDKYYYMYYQLNGKQKEEGLGWVSEGWTLNEVKKILCRIKKNIKLGLHPQSLKEIRDENERKYKEKTQITKRHNNG